MAHSKDNWICILCTHLPLEEEVYFSASFACCLFLFIFPPRSLTELLRLFCSGSWISLGNRLFSSNIASKATKQEWILHQNQGNIWWGALWKSGCRKNFKKWEAELKHCHTPRKTLDFLLPLLLTGLDFGGFFSQLGNWDLFSPKGHIFASHPLNSWARSSKSDGMESWNC